MSGGPKIQPDVATSVRQLNHLCAQTELRILNHHFIIDQAFGVVFYRMTFDPQTWLNCSDDLTTKTHSARTWRAWHAARSRLYRETSRGHDFDVKIHRCYRGVVIRGLQLSRKLLNTSAYSAAGALMLIALNFETHNIARIG
jgi:hypothetical protein